MLVLCSNGLSGEKIRKELGRKAAGCKTAALVVTADHEYKEKNYHVERVTAELEALHLCVSVFDLDKSPAEGLLSYDVVEFIGGNPFYLLHSIRKNHATGVLKTIAGEKILIGWSAAAFVFGPTLELVNMYSPELNFPGLTDLRGIHLTDIEVLPHYSRFLSRFEGFEEKCKAYERKHAVTVIRLNDGEGVFIEAGGIKICRI